MCVQWRFRCAWVLRQSDQNISCIATDKRGYPHNIFLISPQKHMFSWRIKKDISIFLDEKKNALSVAMPMGAFWIASGAKFLHVDNKESDQTVWMHSCSLIGIFSGCILDIQGCKDSYVDNEESEFSETPNPAYFYAYFCFCTRKISFRGFSFTLSCPNWTSKTYRGLPKFLLSVEIDTRSVQKLSKSPPTFNELYNVCPAYLLEIRYLCWLVFKDVPLSARGSFIDIGVKHRGTLLMAAWSLCVFVTRAELINWCLYN